MWATIVLILAVFIASAILRAYLTGDHAMPGTPPIARPDATSPASTAIATPTPAARHGQPIASSLGLSHATPLRPPGEDPATVVVDGDGEIDVEFGPPAVAEAVVDLSGDSDQG